MRSSFTLMGILSVMCICMLFNAACLGSWHTEVIDDTGFFYHASIQLDSEQNPRVVYKGNDVLKYAFSTGSSWQISAIDYVSPGELGFVLDTVNRPHVSYTVIDSGDLKYAFYDGTTWCIETVATGDIVNSANCSIDLDSLNRPHILFYGTPEGCMRHAWKDGASWSFENIAAFAGTGSIEIVIDDLDQIHVCFFSAQTTNRQQLMYGRKIADDWVCEVADVEIGSDCSMVIDNWGFAHISYCKAGYFSIMGYTTKDENGWHPYDVDTYIYNGHYSTIAVTHDRFPHMVYYGHAWHNGSCVYSYKDQWGWHIQDIAASDHGFSLALDNQELPHLTYTDLQGYLTYCWSDSPNPSPTPTPQSTRSWMFEQVFSETLVESNSLQLDQDGYPHIGFHNRTAETLKYASRDVFGWHLETVDLYGRVGYGTQLEISQNDSPMLAYLDINFKLKYAFKDTTGWDIEQVQSAYGLGYPLCIESVGNDQVHVLYQNSSFQGSCYAFRDLAGWNREAIMIDGLHFSGSSLAIDASGLPHIVGSLQNGDCVHAYRTEAGWQSETIPCIGDLVMMMLNESGYPQIVCFVNDELQFLYQDSEGYHSELIDDMWVRYFGDMVLDSGGNPHLLYSAGYMGVSTIRYAFRDSNGWHIETVPYETDGVFKGSIDLDNQNGIHICFNTSRLTYGYSGPGLPPTATPFPGTTPTPTPTFYYHPSATPSAPPSFTPSPTPSGTVPSPWSVENLESYGFPCGDMKMDSMFRPCAVIQSFDRAGLLFVRMIDGSWEYELIADYTWPKEIALDLNASDSPLISTIGDGEEYLIVYWQENDLWQTVSLDFGVFIDTDCKIDPFGKPHVAYYAEMGELRYAHRDISGWHVETVMLSDYSVLSGHLSMSLDSDGIPHIILSSGEILTYLIRTGTGWEIEPIDLGADQPCFPAMDLDSQNYPHLVYYERLHDILKYLYRDTSGWHLECVNYQYTDYNLNAFVLDESDLPHVAYYHFGRMNYGFRGSGDWMFEKVDGLSQNPGQVAIDASEVGGNVYIGVFIQSEQTEIVSRLYPEMKLRSNSDTHNNPNPIQSLGTRVEKAVLGLF